MPPPPPMAVRRWHISFRRQSKIPSDLRPSPDGSTVRTWWPAVARLQAASVPIGSCAVGQTDGRTDRQTGRAVPKCPLGLGA